ncbi:hypothetical protein WN48_00727 [Eufriesea mexicana]|uniref:Uncharacterized protein n=1 Tax=Eufriesea mexicana TaxID=516756 RepID=A0A310S7X1_9HYME|nr:hypothetical protein WN48_00727 [Eufriesea mexicana]
MRYTFARKRAEDCFLSRENCMSQEERCTAHDLLALLYQQCMHVARKHSDRHDTFKREKRRISDLGYC